MARLLFVCTGNVCRSPFMELYFRNRLTDPGTDRLEVSSAGTRALVGAPMDPVMASLAPDLDPSDHGFRARQLARAEVEAAQLVITATRRHRAEVVHLLPAAHARTFTLLQASRLLEVAATHEPAEPAGLDGLARQLAKLRGRRPAHGSDDVPDPYGGPVAGYARSIDLMRPALESLWLAVKACAN